MKSADKMITVICYGQIEKMTKDEAMAKYRTGMKCCEGSERDRYERIVCDIERDCMVCSDGDELRHSEKILEVLRKEYPIGTRVELLEMDDRFAPPIGTKGIVKHVDDMGTIHITWDTGSSLGAVFGKDVIKKV